MRVTKKLLIKLVNEALKRVELPFTCYSITRTTYPSHLYEGGAHFWRANLTNEDTPPDGTTYIVSFDQFRELESEFNSGTEPTLFIKYKGRTATLSTMYLTPFNY